jgi:hypothetical protein
MNDTLNRIKAQAERARSRTDEQKQSTVDAAQQRHEAALPLLRAFADVKDHFVKIDVLKAIWPDQYHQRDDRARGLVVALLGGERQPHGLRLRVPRGFQTWEVTVTWTGDFAYVVSRESEGGRPVTTQFDRPEPWLDTFYQAMASLLEL